MRQKISAWGAIIALFAVETLLVFGTMSAKAAPLTDGLAPVVKSEAAWPVRMYPGVIYRGGLVAVSNGIAYPAANVDAYRVVGVAADTVDNQATAAGYSATRRCVVRQGVFAFANSYTGSGTNAVYSVQVTDVGKPAFVIDDQTVCASSNGFNTVAGTVASIEPDLRTVWIDVGKVWVSSVTTNAVAR